MADSIRSIDLRPPFRVADMADSDFLMTLEQACFEAYRRSTLDMIKRSIASDHQLVFLLEEDGRSLGSVTLRQYKNQLRMMSLAVSPKEQGKQYGGQLVTQAIEIAKKLNYEGMTLEVDMNNEVLIRWYEGFGFEQIKVLDHYYKDGQHAIRMKMTLDHVFQYLVVTDYDTDFFDGFANMKHVRADAYIDVPEYQQSKDIRLFNFCANYKYQTVGYYVSLLATARNQVAYPSAGLIRDMANPKVLKSIGEEIHELIQSELAACDKDALTINSLFGKSEDLAYQKIVNGLNNLYHAPLIRYYLKKRDYWYLDQIKILSLKKMCEEEPAGLKASAQAYFNGQKFVKSAIKIHEYDMAILIDPEEAMPPSNQKAIEAIVKAAGQVGFYVELITKKDFARIPEFDALFIRTTTNVNDYTYDFSRYAYAEGLVVIDDPWSILRCANKIYLHEALSNAGVRTPKTLVLNKKNMKRHRLEDLTYPLILKLPDSAFSAGVYKVKNSKDCRVKLKEMFKRSELILCQEYMPTDYDWRIGVLDGKLLYACKYFMAKGHWQIVNWAGDQEGFDEGPYEAIDLKDVPKTVTTTALKAAKVIGDGLYGVDIKLVKSKAYVIEVNDNPSLEAGVEDAIEGDDLYNKILRSFLSRLESNRVNLRNIN